MVTTIGVILFLLVFVLVGLLIVNSLGDSGVMSSTESFGVSDPTVARVCNLVYTPYGSVTVEYYNGASWTTLSSSDYTVSGKTVTVKASAMD